MANDTQTIWQFIKGNWMIKKYEIQDMGINPNKPWDDITLSELDRLSTHLDILISDLINE